MSIETTTSVIEVGVAVVVALTATITFLLKSHFRKVESLDLTEMHKNEKWSSPVEARTKYPELDVFRVATSLRIYGLMMALALMILAFSWTTYEQQMDISGMIGAMSDEIEMETPRTNELPPPPPPPPPAPSVVNLMVTDIPQLETTLFQDQSIDETSSIIAPIYERKEAPTVVAPPPPPPPSAEVEQEIFKIVEEAPTFPGCEAIENKPERQQCAEQKLIEFIYQRIRYPEIALQNGIQGTVYVKFVVERDGSISNIEVIRDIGGSCGDEVVRVVQQFPNWNPGKQRGMPVRVQFTLPVKFDFK